MDEKKDEDKRWYTVSIIGKYETIVKDTQTWVNAGYTIKETETEVLLIKNNR